MRPNPRLQRRTIRDIRLYLPLQLVDDTTVYKGTWNPHPALSVPINSFG
jgi:hypothetical protein